MCYNCGCEMPDDDMGHPENITNALLSRVAGELGEEPDVFKKRVKESLEAEEADPSKNLDPKVEEMISAAAVAWGQSVGEAKKNTLHLLKKYAK